MEPADDFHVGLVVRTSNESILIWSPEHDLVSAPGGGLNSQWPVGTWIQYKAITDGSMPINPDNATNPNMMVYDISRVRNNCLFPDVHVRYVNDNEQIELSTFVTSNLLRYLDANSFLVEDNFLGPVLCESNSELVHKFEDATALIELKLIFSEDFPDLSRFVALAFRDDSSENWTELKSLAQKEKHVPSGRKEFGTMATPKQVDENERNNTMKVFGTMAAPKQTETYEDSRARNTFGTLSKAIQTDGFENGADKCMPSTSNKIRAFDEHSKKSQDSINSLFSLNEADPYEENMGEFVNWSAEIGRDDGGGERTESASEPNQQEREYKIIAELAHYQNECLEGLQRRKRSVGLVVEKMFDYAIVYSKKYGLVILPSSRFSSLQEFDSFCVIGQWVLTVIVEVPDSRHLTFTHMCLPPFERTNQKNVQTLINREGNVEILLNCDFSVSNLKALRNSQYILATELGDVLVSESFIQQNDIFENVSNVWVRYIGGKYFFWEIDAEAKLVADSEDEIFFGDSEPTCSNITKQLASVFTCNDEELIIRF